MSGQTEAGCIFCKLATKVIPAKTIAETDSSLTMHSVDPAAPTHVVVIPKDHYGTAADLADKAPDVMADVMREACKAAAALGLAAEGYRMVVDTSHSASQEMTHAQVHVMGGRNMNWPPG
ncbi:HIT domain-containing protein [Streptomyces anulatus]